MLKLTDILSIQHFVEISGCVYEVMNRRDFVAKSNRYRKILQELQPLC